MESNPCHPSTALPWLNASTRATGNEAHPHRHGGSGYQSLEKRNSVPWAFRYGLYTTLLSRRCSEFHVFSSWWIGVPDPPSYHDSITNYPILRVRRCFHCRLTGLRRASMISGVSVIQRGPRGVERTLSRNPVLHQSAIVKTSTLSSLAVALAE